jgi:hypothetical protein
MNTPLQAAAEAFREYAWGYTVGDVTDFAGARAVVAAYLKARLEQSATEDPRGGPTTLIDLLVELEGDTDE